MTKVIWLNLPPEVSMKKWICGRGCGKLLARYSDAAPLPILRFGARPLPSSQDNVARFQGGPLASRKNCFRSSFQLP